MGEHFFSFGHGPRSMLEDGINPFEHCKHILAQADVVVANLEGPVSDIGYERTNPFSRVFRGHPNSANALREAGINVVTVANNHSLQHGPSCYSDSITTLEASGITVIGKSRSIDRWTSVSATGQQVAFLAASSVPDPEHDSTIGYRSFDLENLCLDIKEARSSHNHVIVILHWGNEDSVIPDETMRQIANALVASGATIVAGHHPHILYPFERVQQESLIAYSLGNFVFDLPWSKQLRQSAILDVELTGDSLIHKAQAWPVYISKEGMPHPNGAPIPLPSRTDQHLTSTIYEHKRLAKNLQTRKLIFLLCNIHKGDTVAKLRFIWQKAKNIL